MAFQGAVADVLAFHPRQRGEHGEHDAGRVVGALKLAAEELQADAVGAQLLGECGELDAAAEPLVLVHEIFSAKTRVTPEAFSESAWVSSDWRAVEARAYPIRTCPAAAAVAAGRGSSAQADPGLRSGGTGTLRAFARRGTSRNRAVWYWAATFPRPVRHGDPAGAAQEDIGQSFVSMLRKSSSLTPRSFHVGVSFVQSFATTHETAVRLVTAALRPVSQVTACETGCRLSALWRLLCFAAVSRIGWVLCSGRLVDEVEHSVVVSHASS
ncbi:MAG: hypothetical protein JWM19_5621, partial [Actinomycetia bacterium]|nr:hypothetical protein [Actinomycetes bacterium]